MNSNIDGGKTLSSAISQPMQGNHSFISERDLAGRGKDRENKPRIRESGFYPDDAAILIV